MLHLLPSKNKLLKMNRLEIPGHDATNICIQCDVLSDSSHQIAYCIYPTYVMYALNNLPVWKDKLPSLKLNPLIFEFQTGISTIQDSTLKHQTDLILLTLVMIGGGALCACHFLSIFLLKISPPDQTLRPTCKFLILGIFCHTFFFLEKFSI